MENMIKSEDIIADLHTHTIFSGHAFSTVKENIEEGIQHGMEYIAITDHFYVPDDRIERENATARLAYMQHTIGTGNGVQVISGSEFNLNQDIPEDFLKKIPHVHWKLIGLHSWFADIPNSSLYDIYKMFEKAVSLEMFTAFAHIERGLEKTKQNRSCRDNLSEAKSFLRCVVDLAVENNLYLEVNESSLDYMGGKGNTERMEYWLSYAKEKNARICMGTDAHYCSAVGVFTRSIDMLNKVGYPKELILNCNRNQLAF